MNDHILSLQEDSEFLSTISPVSPKPQYLPTQSNIPILQYQMDPSLNESSTYPGPHAPQFIAHDLVQADPAVLEHDIRQDEDGQAVKQEDGVHGEIYSNGPDANTKRDDGDETQASTDGKTTPEAQILETIEHLTDQDVPSLDADRSAVSLPAEETSEKEGEPTTTETIEDDQNKQVDIQALLDTIVKNAAGNSGSSLPAPVSSLPTKPVGSQQTLHGAHGTFQITPGSLTTAGAPGTFTSPGSLPPPPLATFQRPPSTPSSSDARRNSDLAVRDRPSTREGSIDQDKKWSPMTQKKYDKFLEEEREWVQKGEWDKFPPNSRLFLGNLPSESVTKRDLFHVFHHHGQLAQLSIKQAFGFVQFLDPDDCLRALKAEQGVSIRGENIHLEISKSKALRRNNRKRSRSPDRNYQDGGRQRNGDTYRGRDYHARGRQRSPSPARYGRRFSRSPSPYRRFRTPSPRRDMDDECPLPRRAPHEVPEVQIIAQGDPDRTFVGYVESAFQNRGVRTNVLLLSPRLSETAVMRRQIIEGVLAVVRLDPGVQMSRKFSLSIFDRSAGANNVRFDEYSQLDLTVIVELVLRAKSISKPAAKYNTGPYGLPLASPAQPPRQLPPPPLPLPPAYFNQPASAPQYPPIDPRALQSLLGQVQQSPPQQLPYGGGQQTSNPAVLPELSRLLANVNGAGGTQNYIPQQQQQQSTSQLLASLAAANPNVQQQLQQLSQQQQQQQPPQPHGPVDMKNILAGLARWEG